MNSLEFAVNMELEGERYYTRQAEINKDNSLQVVFLMLAKDEDAHAEILRSKCSELPYELKDNGTLAGAKNVFTKIGNFKSEVREIPNQLELYQDALNKEKESIKLYEKLLAESVDPQSKELFEYLIGQEKDHCAVLEELVLMVSRPNVWVESAEFGVREEY